jgi:SAM-dependent methyltransferase
MNDDRFVDAPPSGADGWRDVWEHDRRFRPRPSRFDFVVRFFRRLVNRSVEAEEERQRNFNVALLDLVAGLRADLGRARDDLKGDIETVQHDVRTADEALAVKFHDLILVAAKRNDALIAALDQKIETVAVRVRDVTNPPVASSSATAHDVLYRRLEDGLRGAVDVADYVTLAGEQQPVVDIGCGRGEFLAACRAAGIDARGFDTNERSVADLVARGIDAAVAGVPSCFANLGDASVGTIVAMHVVEHLPIDALFALFAEASRVLRKGGRLIIETPNAESLAVSASEFWRDPTHLAPRHPAALTLLGREHRFAIDDVRAIHPFPEGNRFVAASEETRALVEALNERIFGGQDLRLILRRE